MTREALILDLCPTDCIGEKCEQFDCEDVCYPMLRRMFDKYDEQIRADVIDECIKTLAENEDTILTDKQYYILQNFKEKKDE